MLSDMVEPGRSSADFESLITDVSSRFIGLAAGDVDREIDHVLRRVCTWFTIDFAVLWQWPDESPDAIVPTHFCFAEVGLHPSEPPDERHFPWYRQQMLSGRLVAISSLDDLPPEAVTDRERGRLLGIKSAVTIPLTLGGERPVGALALNVTGRERPWPATTLERLELVAQVITTALARQRTGGLLRNAEQRLSLAVEAAGAGLWTFDRVKEEFWATSQVRRVFGYAPDEVMTLRRFEATVHPEDRCLVREAIERSQRTDDAFDVEYRIVVPGEADVRWIAWRGRSVVTSPFAGRRLMGISLDVTEHRRLADELVTNQARLQAGAELAGLGFYETDYRTGVLRGDDRFRALLGIPEGVRDHLAVLQWWGERVHREDQSRVLELRRRLHDGVLDRIATDYRYAHPQRGEIWIDHLAAAVERDDRGRLLRNIGVLRDVGHQKRIENDLRQMSQRLLQAQEQERALIARELHDDLSQRLAVLAIDVARAEAVPGADHTSVLRTVREELVRVSEDVHALAYQLHPSVLSELGLADALRAECARRARQGGLEWSWSIDAVPDDVAEETALGLFRVAQEAISNAVRHAEASKLSVELRLHDGGVLLAVRDDGVGYDRKLAGRGRLGMLSMSERMRIVKGTIDIDSEPGSGTTVVAWVPVSGEAT